MTGGSERGAGERAGSSATAQVPIGWRRTVENGAVAYISPSGTLLSSVEEVGSYLLTDGTCKCGLECPLVVHKVFNFDPGAVLLQRPQLPGKAEEDMTKLCNHRRKVVAMAALCRSMQASHGTGGPFCSMESRDLRVGPLGAREEGGWGSYSPRPRPSAQPKLSPSPTPPHPPLSFPFNGSLPLSRPNSSSRLSPRKPPPPSPNRSPFSCYGPQSSSCPSPGAGLGRAGLVGSPPPFSSSPSPCGSQDCPSPRQRSRHSSASSSSLSEQGGVGVVVLAAYPPGGTRPPCPPHSPKSLPPVSPVSRLEDMLQQYKDAPPSPLPLPQPQSNQSNFPPAQNQNHLVPPPAFASDRKSAVAASANTNAGFLGQLLSQQKQQQHVSSFPASSLLSAAAKAQLASQMSRSPSHGANANAHGASTNANAHGASTNANANAHGASTNANAHGASTNANANAHTPGANANANAQAPGANAHAPGANAHANAHAPGANANAPGGVKEAPQSKVLMSTLHSSARTPPTSHTLLIPHSSPSPSSSSSSSSSSCSSPRGPRPLLDKAAAQRRRQRRSPTVLSMLKESQLCGLRAPSEPSSSSTSHPESLPQPGPPPKQPADAQDSKRAVPTQPLSALLHLLSIQSAQTSASAGPAPGPSHAPSSPGPSLTLPAHYPAPPASLAPAHQQPQSPAHPSSPLAFPPVGVAEEMADGQNPGPVLTLGQNPSPVLTLGQNPSPVLTLGQPQDVGGQILSLLGQLTSCPPAGPLEERGPQEPNGGPTQSHSVAAGTLVTLDPRCSPAPGPALAPPPSPGEPQGALQLAESFPFMSQDQLLQLLSAHSLLAPPFLGSLPIGLWMGGGAQTQGPPQTPPPPALLNHSSQLSILPSMLGAQGDLPVSLLGLLNPGLPPPAPPPGGAPPGELGEKLQALLTASLLLPLAGLGQPLDLLLGQQPFDASGLEKGPAGAPDSSPGLLEALQSLLLPPPPPAFLSLSPALLAAALTLPDTPPSQQPLHPHPPQAPSQVTLSSPALGSSVSCASLMPSSAPDVADALTTMTGPGKAHALPPHLMPPLLAPGVLADLAALGNMGGLHSMMGAGPLLLPPMQAPGLGMPLLQGQAGGLNPLACLLNNLQLNMGPALSMGGEKPMGMHEASSPAPQDNISANQLAPEPVPNPSHALGPQPQREGAPGALLDPYSSFMDTIYTSFLQVSGRSPDPSLAPPPSVPGEGPQPSAPPPLSPRRACSLRNPDLSRLGMEAAQSPARGTPKLSEDTPSPPAPLSQRSEPPAPPAFPEQAKTDCSSAHPYGGPAHPYGGPAHPYSNGLLSEGEGRGEGPQGVNGTENHTGPEDALGERGPTVRTGGARRGRKRKQVLPREPDGSREMDTGVSEEPRATMVLQKPERSVKSKRRRVFR
ncbi:methyl-CpG-binding domain protein 6 [Conger conger]|uniref:methyl-CpG-binding domain protein 6 n=1 Tax=Conger conger TaxID=82655 RepID=UPI002A5A6F37|nr:methyl-CpG-binding domain protein 6 [Conger conger]